MEQYIDKVVEKLMLPFKDSFPIIVPEYSKQVKEAIEDAVWEGIRQKKGDISTWVAQDIRGYLNEDIEGNPQTVSGAIERSIESYISISQSEENINRIKS
jgi:hypothetical protein